MSWADDIRCLYCDGRLPLYRKITNGQFCSSAHRKAYWQEQERLAVERLHQTHDSLRAYRPAGSVESILGRANPSETPEPVPVPVPAVAVEAERPWWLVLVNSGRIPEVGFVPERVHSQPRWPSDGLAGSDPAPMDYTRGLHCPVNVHEIWDCGFAPADRVGLDLASPKPAGRLAAVEALAPLDVTPDVAIDPVCRLVFEVSPDLFEFEAEEIPPFAKLLGLPRTTARDTSAPENKLVPEASLLRPQLPLDAALRQATLSPTALVHAGLSELPMNRAPLPAGPFIESLRALDSRSEGPLFTLSTPPARPRLRLAAGRRYAVETQLGAAPAKSAEAGAMAVKAPVVSLPKRIDGATPAAPAPMHQPDRAGMVPLAGIAQPKAAIEMRPAPAALTLPQPPRTEPIRPQSRLEPMKARPAIDLSSEPNIPAGPPPIPGSAEQPQTELTGQERANIWIHALDFWNRAPRDLKMLTFAIPVLLGLALHPSLPKVRVTAPAQASGFEKSFQRAVNEQFVNVRQTVLERAAVALDEDFRSGLDYWASPGDASTDWSFDATGFVRPGPLAIYRPTMGLTDYQEQFLGMIDKRAISWVARAADFQNYYVMKLVVLKGGPLPVIGLTRYAVVNGKADSRVDRAVPVDAREDMLYRVRLDVQGDDFSLTVQGQMVDAWSEPRLARGGIGFFSARGEESRLRWVQVTHQYDMLGRLCAYLAPYNFSSTGSGITSTSGSWQP